jgi:hypothetical protein
LKNLGLDGRMVLKFIFKRLDGGMDWSDVVQERERWRALLNAVMNLRFSYSAGNFLPCGGLVSC